MEIDKLLQDTLSRDASDLHISVGYPPLIRRFGRLEPLSNTILTIDSVRKLVYSILTDAEKKEFDRNLQIDLAIERKGIGRFRVNVFHERQGFGIILRAVKNRIMTLEELELPDQIAGILSGDKGLFLVTGPTGSGKSTTLAAMVEHINRNFHKHIITLEDPIEFIYEGKNSEIHQRQLGKHMHSFSDGLRSALREDPDIILVGELRDFETISLALTAAETGHLVMGTLHTTSALKTIDRIIDSFSDNQQGQIRAQLSESLKAVISQKLVPRIDREGLIGVVEILISTSAVKNLIREGKTFQIASVIQTGLRFGMQTFEQAMLNLVKKEIISEDYLPIKQPVNA